MDLANIELDRHRTSQLLTSLVIAIGALVLIFSLGQWIGRFQVANLYWSLIVTVTLIVVFGLQRRVWIFMVAAWPFTASGVFLPLSFRELGIMLAIITYATYRIVSRQRIRLTVNALDQIFWLNIAWVIFTYAIHPAGVRILGSSTIGGRNLFGVIIAILAYLVVTRLPDSVRTVSRIPIIMLIGMLAASVLLTVRYFVPALAEKLAILYAMFDVSAFLAEAETADGFTMLRGYAFIGVLLLQVMCAYFRPLALFNPFRLRAYGFYLAIVMILISGYRSSFGMILPFMLISSWLRRGWREAVAVSAIFIALLVPTLIGQGRMFELPMAAQRSLSFLPAKWDPLFVKKEPGLKGIDSRFDWWERIIREKQIKNWWIGDGYVASAYDYATLAGSTAATARQEWMNITGAYHNGPLTTIRYVGLVGLALLYALMITAAVHAVRCVRRSQRTILYPVTIFLAIHTVWKPFHFTLLFGAWQVDVPEVIFYCGLVRLVTRMLDENAVAKAAPIPFQPENRLARNLPPARSSKT